MIYVKDTNGNRYMLTSKCMRETRPSYYHIWKADFIYAFKNKHAIFTRFIYGNGYILDFNFRFRYKLSQRLSIGCRRFDRKNAAIIRAWALGKKQ